jgi:hypothetical protein
MRGLDMLHPPPARDQRGRPLVVATSMVFAIGPSQRATPGTLYMPWYLGDSLEDAALAFCKTMTTVFDVSLTLPDCVATLTSAVSVHVGEVLAGGSATPGGVPLGAPGGPPSILAALTEAANAGVWQHVPVHGGASTVDTPVEPGSEVGGQVGGGPGARSVPVPVGGWSTHKDPVLLGGDSESPPQLVNLTAVAAHPPLGTPFLHTVIDGAWDPELLQAVYEEFDLVPLPFWDHYVVRHGLVPRLPDTGIRVVATRTRSPT